MRFALDVLADASVEQVDEARGFYTSRPAGRGPSSFQQLREMRERRSAPSPSPADPPAIAETVEAAYFMAHSLHANWHGSEPQFECRTPGR